MRSQIIPNSSYEKHRNYLHTATSKAAAFGDSRVAMGFLDSPDFANLAYPSENLSTILAKLRYYHRTRQASKIVLQADPHHFSNYRLTRDQSALRDDLFMRTSFWLQILRPTYRQYLFNYWRTYFWNAIKTASSSIESARTEARVERLSDFPASTLRKWAQIRMQLHVPIRTFRKTRTAEVYERTVSDLRSAGVEVCLVGFPVSSAYRDASREQPSIADARSFYREIAARTGVILIDLWNFFDDAYFQSADHLNAEGARLLTSEVRKRCFPEKT